MDDVQWIHQSSPQGFCLAPGGVEKEGGSGRSEFTHSDLVVFFEFFFFFPLLTDVIPFWPFLVSLIPQTN